MSGRQDGPELDAEMARRLCSRAVITWLDAQTGYYGHLPECPGVWATGATVEACRVELREVLDGWLMLGGSPVALHTLAQ